MSATQALPARCELDRDRGFRLPSWRGKRGSERAGRVARGRGRRARSGARRGPPADIPSANFIKKTLAPSAFCDHRNGATHERTHNGPLFHGLAEALGGPLEGTDPAGLAGPPEHAAATLGMPRWRCSTRRWRPKSRARPRRLAREATPPGGAPPPPPGTLARGLPAGKDKDCSAWFLVGHWCQRW